MTDRNPCPPMRGHKVKWNGRKQDVVAAYRNAQTGMLWVKIGRTWYQTWPA